MSEPGRVVVELRDDERRILESTSLAEVGQRADTIHFSDPLAWALLSWAWGDIGVAINAVLHIFGAIREIDTPPEGMSSETAALETAVDNWLAAFNSRHKVKNAEEP